MKVAREKRMLDERKDGLMERRIDGSIGRMERGKLQN
jgi:hypothetical protein